MIFGKVTKDRIGAGQALDLGDAHAALVGHEADGAEDADAGEDLEGRVREAGDERRTGQVRLALEVGGVGQHDTEAHRQRVEDLREGGQPDLGISERGPVRGKEGIEALNGTGQEERANDERQEEDDEQREEDLVSRFDTLGQASSDHKEDKDPHEREGNHHRPGGSPGERITGDNLQERISEERRRVVAPSRIHRVDRVLHAPREDRAVVDHDDEADEGLEPADELAASDDLAQCPRR